MKKYIFLIWSSSFLGAINVSGDISTSTWSVSDSPVYIIGNTRVLENQTLTIDPGVEVKFFGNDILVIDGILVAEGTANNKIGIFSFTIDKVHYFDLGLLLDAKGIAIRTGHHCTQPLMEKYHLDGTARLSLALYNTKDEVDYFIESLTKIISK